jgi:hypothetical protein
LKEIGKGVFGDVCIDFSLSHTANIGLFFAIGQKIIILQVSLDLQLILLEMVGDHNKGAISQGHKRGFCWVVLDVFESVGPVVFDLALSRIYDSVVALVVFVLVFDVGVDCRLGLVAHSTCTIKSLLKLLLPLGFRDGALYCFDHDQFIV